MFPAHFLRICLLTLLLTVICAAGLRARGEFLGFKGAAAMAAAAQTFGQDDGITVLTLARVGA